jgi:hypothetical protein
MNGSENTKSQEERSLFWEVTVPVIVKEKKWGG